MNIVSFSPFGYEGALVVVEVDLRRGIPSCDVVGLADCAVKEARERMRAAIRNSGLPFPPERVLINLSPADLKKEGSGFDLAIALAVLQSSEEKPKSTKPILVMGELELSGKLRWVRGTHAAILTAAQEGIKYCIIPKDHIMENTNLGDIRIFSVDNLLEAQKALDIIENLVINEEKIADNSKAFQHEFSQKTSVNGIERQNHISIEFSSFPKDMDFAFVKNQSGLVRALQVAAAGNHNILAYGPPGCGKTLSMQRFYSLLPNLSVQQSQEVTRIWSLAGLLSAETEMIKQSPFRMPHQSASLEGMVGGGLHCHPGEVSLAHNGVLFLDEAAEFKTSVLQTLRVPLESRSITLSRAGRHTIFPANFQLLIATNPCPCGNFGSKDKICLCSASSVESYWKKFSGPLLDRVDIRMPVFQNQDGTTIFAQKAGITSGTSTEELRIGIKKAREIQLSRQGKLNSELTPEEIDFYCQLSPENQKYLFTIAEKYDFSTRGIHSCKKLARTIADISESYEIIKDFLEEAIFYRKNHGPLDIF